jgi:hypothetical protein
MIKTIIYTPKQQRINYSYHFLAYFFSRNSLTKVIRMCYINLSQYLYIAKKTNKYESGINNSARINRFYLR